MADNEAPDEKYICIAGGPGTRDGATAFSEVHPDHPFHVSARLVNGAVDPGIGEHQVFVVKGAPGNQGVAWAARTPDVQRALGRQFIVEVKSPSWLPAPIEGPVTETSLRVANREAELQPVTVGDQAVSTEDDIERLKAELDAAKTELAARQKAEEDRLNAAQKAQEDADAAREKAEADAARAAERPANRTQNQRNG